ncbi:MAG TPA: hypothetical protein VG247_07370 [Pseudonocardiaceae bacterium]|jgi:hypothetical protein|nr:hypothetical protein [Pseudonocardiaceae bacterium]
MSESSQDAIDKINQLAGQPTAPTAPTTGLTDGAAAMANGSQAMLAQAQSGGFTLDPHTGQALINTINQQIETLNDAGTHIATIARETKLGMTAGGQAIAKFNQEVAATGSRAFAPAHQQFVQTLTTMVQAIQIAMDNYVKTEDDNVNKLKPKD